MPAPVISSGHQPGFHHPGILAKRIALAKEAASRGGGSAWLVADQDIDDPEVIRYPDLDEQERETLSHPLFTQFGKVHQPGIRRTRTTWLGSGCG